MEKNKQSQKQKRQSNNIFILIVVAILLGLGASAFYLGYYKPKLQTPEQFLMTESSGFKIVFFRNSEIYSVNSDGTNLKNLTNNSYYDTQPALSKDGKKIVFASSRAGNKEEIYTMNADGSNVVRLTNDTAQDLYPSFSPDGKKIVYVHQNFDSKGVENFDIYKMNSDGSGKVRLTTASGSEGYEIDPAFSPDGKKIVYLKSYGSDFIIKTMNADGSGKTTVKTGSLVGEHNPSYSPDGTKIIFGARIGNTKDIYRVGTNGSGLTKLTKSQLNKNVVPNLFTAATWPAYAPDGRIVYIWYSAGTTPAHFENLYVMNADGTNPVRILFSSYKDYMPSASVL